MKLDCDCVRDTLLALETMGFNESLRIPQLAKKPQLAGYTEDEIHYTCLKLLEAGYIAANAIPIGAVLGIVDVTDITYPGHEFLNTIREDKNWRKVKSAAKAAGVFSLKGLAETGIKVASAMIEAALEGNL